MNEAPAARRRLIIDTDGGVDDAAALWWALGDPRIELVGVTTVAGVVSAAAAADNVLCILDRAGRPDIPVAVGADRRFGAAPHLRPADFIHGADGLGNTQMGRTTALKPSPENAGELLRRLAGERPVSVVSLGPLTNIAHAVADAAFVARIDELIVMGGSVTRGGNALPAAEANIAHDPDAAATVVRARWRQPPLLVGLDVTLEATLDASDFELLAERRTAAATFLDAPLRFYRTFASTLCQPHCPCHDLLAVMALVETGLISDAPVLPLAVDTAQGPAWGATVVDLRAPHFARLGGSDQARPDGFELWRIALGADGARFRTLVRRFFGEGTPC